MASNMDIPSWQQQFGGQAMPRAEVMPFRPYATRGGAAGDPQAQGQALPADILQRIAAAQQILATNKITPEAAAQLRALLNQEDLMQRDRSMDDRSGLGMAALPQPGPMQGAPQMNMGPPAPMPMQGIEGGFPLAAAPVKAKGKGKAKAGPSESDRLNMAELERIRARKGLTGLLTPTPAGPGLLAS